MHGRRIRLSPDQGQRATSGNHTKWVKIGGLWYSPKDVSGLPRVLGTPEHIKALKVYGKLEDVQTLPRLPRKNLL